ncbi:hypothetical protein DOTSEDRAFT_75119 [Dothistroma septosporum NZE10]|uniref:NTF2 domain-containing protein n=1 Tax=Dothistroma septosporum (strain NZE10 / CBS 128990) TaxID=675120 RepID=M2YK66_DOTSN|nr:hypothetical protein DOTSEDRAFT_75119 [Dothistroma septosporum NZE10]
MAAEKIVELTDAELTKVATETAESFVDSFYTALHISRATVGTYYQAAVANEADAKRNLPFVCWNGEAYFSGTEFQKEFDKMPYFFLEVQSLNAHILNPCVSREGKKSHKEAERNVTISLQVSGYVRLFERKDGPMRGFADHIILTANKDTSKAGEGRQWVIQTQNFRFVV